MEVKTGIERFPGLNGENDTSMTGFLELSSFNLKGKSFSESVSLERENSSIERKNLHYGSLARINRKKTCQKRFFNPPTPAELFCLRFSQNLDMLFPVGE